VEPRAGGVEGIVFVHPVVHNDELLSRIAEHDMGFAGERGHCRNNDLTVSNKILHFLLAGLAVVASDTAGHREVAEQAAGAVWLYPPGNAPALAACLNSLLRSSDRLERSKHVALAAAQKAFCWDRQEPALRGRRVGVTPEKLSEPAPCVERSF
jgi:Glycosyl transferases group 1